MNLGLYLSTKFVIETKKDPQGNSNNIIATDIYIGNECLPTTPDSNTLINEVNEIKWEVAMNLFMFDKLS